jgi:hypothetical protein
MSQLQAIREETTTVYRGDTYNPHVQKGDVVTFKSFTSTSSSASVAKNFKDKPSESTDRTLWTMHIRGGKSIKNYSAYVTED